jgi:hypothetical protein
VSQPQQIIFSTPSNDQIVIDNSAAPTFPSMSAGTHIGYDTPSVANVPAGANSQGSNPKADTGSVLLDISGNDTVWADPQCGTVTGNPVALTLPTFKTVTKVVQDSFRGLQVCWKNPAVVIF